MLDVETAMRHRSNDLVDQDGEKVGRIKEIYVDDRTGEPAWALVSLGVLGKAAHFVPIDEAEVDGERLKVAFTKEQVEQAPSIEDDRHLDADEERALYRHYGLDYDAGEEPATDAAAKGTGGRLRKHVVADAHATPEDDTAPVAETTTEVDTAPETIAPPPAAATTEPAPQPVMASAHVAASARDEPSPSTLHQRGQPAAGREAGSSLPAGGIAAAAAGVVVTAAALLVRRRRAAARLARARSAGGALAPLAVLLLVLAALKRRVSRRGRGPRARDIMTGGADCALETDTLEQAARMMAALDVGALPICGVDGRLKGMLTDRDIVVKAVAEQRDPALVVVSELAQGKPITVDADDSVEQVLRTMSRHKVRRLPVIDRHQLIGVISQADLAVHLDPERAGQLLEDISTAP